MGVDFPGRHSPQAVTGVALGTGRLTGRTATHPADDLTGHALTEQPLEALHPVQRLHLIRSGEEVRQLRGQTTGRKLLSHSALQLLTGKRRLLLLQRLPFCLQRLPHQHRTALQRRFGGFRLYGLLFHPLLVLVHFLYLLLSAVL